MATNTEDTSVFKLFIKDYCRYSTLHGVRYFTIHVRHWSERLWWMIAFGLALWLSSSMIHTFWVDWQEHPMAMATTNEVNALSEIPFPTVIICPQTQIMRNKFDLSSKFDSKNRLLPNVSHIDKMHLLKLVHVCPGLEDRIPYENDFADEDVFNFIEDVAPNVGDITLSCSWKGAIIDCSEYLKPILTSGNSMCFSFNGLNSRDVYTDEMAPGAMISKSHTNVSYWTMENGYEHDFEEKEYPLRVTGSDEITTLEIDLVIDKRNDDRLCSPLYQGFGILLTPPHEQNAMLDEPIQATLLSDTHVHVTPKLVTTSSGLRKYSPIRRECFFQSERQLQFFKTYSIKNCEMECWANLTKEICGCVDFAMPRDRDTKICGSTKINCFIEALQKYDTSVLNKCNCWDACTSTEYPSHIEQFPLNIIDGKPLNESHRRAKLRVSLQKLQVKTMQRIETVTIIEFLAMCGGVLGLFIGFSVLSLVELIYYPCLRLFCMIQRLKEEEEDEPNDNERPESPTGTSIYIPKRNSRKWSVRLQNFLIEYCINSNIHGVRYFVEPNLRWIGRCFWMICCAVSLLLCGWLTYNVYSQWQSSPMLIKPVKETLPRTSFPLPTITICPEVKATKQKLDLTSALNNLSNLSHIENQRLNALASVCPRLPNSVAFEDHFANESIFDTIQDLAPQFKDTLVKCMINAEFPPRLCSRIMTSILTDDGLCFAFNALNSHEMYTNEMAPGMRMVTGNPNVSHWSLENGYFGYREDEYPTRIPFVASESFIFLFIDKRNFEHQCKPFDGEFKVILTPPGEVLQMSRNYFRIHLDQINKLYFDIKVLKTSDGLRSYTPSERQCFYQSERQLRFFKMYTEANCEAECLANFTSVECGCVHFSMPRDNRTRVCGGASVPCLRAAKRKLLTDESGSAFHNKCNCLPGCVSIEYKAHIHYYGSKLFNKPVATLTITPQNVVANERVERWTVVDFLAFCGGVLGSGLGISVLSFFEILFFITIRLYWITRQWRIENTTAHPSNEESVETVTEHTTVHPSHQESVEMVTENTTVHWITRRRRIENTAEHPSNQGSFEMVTIEHFDE